MPRVCGDDIYIQGALTNPSIRQIKECILLNNNHQTKTKENTVENQIN